MSSPGTKPSAGERALKRFHEEVEIERAADFRMLRRLWPFVRPERRLLFGSLGLLLANAALSLARPLVIKAALDGFASHANPGSTVAEYGVLLGAVIVTEQLLSFPQMSWMQAAGARAMAALRRHLFAFLHTRSMAFFDRTPIGRLVTRVTNDVDAIGEMFASGALNAAGDLVKLLVIVVILLGMDWKMSLFAFAALPPVALAVEWSRRRIRTAYRDVRVRTARINAFLNEQVTGVGVVQAYAHEKESEREFDAINVAYRSANLRAIYFEAALDAAIEAVASMCIAAILWYAGAAGLGVSFGTLFAFVQYIEMFFGPVRDLSARYTLIQGAMTGAERVFELLDSTEHDAGEGEGGAARDRAAAGDEAEDELPPERAALAFELEGVSFGYKAGHDVLHDVSFGAARGETIAIVGPTGSGKTTVASLLLRLYEVTRGKVRVFGKDVRRSSRAELRQQFAVVPQDVFLFPGTVASNVCAGEPEVDMQRVRATLERIGALELFERRAGGAGAAAAGGGGQSGLEAPVVERGANFSAGERQLVAFARALYKNPPILILDEPTSNIDSDTEARLQRAMEAAMQGRTALIIAHRLSTIRSADRIVVMHHGRVVEQGSHEELLAKKGVYERLYRLQAARRAIEQRAGAAE
ncbi:MAG: ABC transporter ATP-binding protein [Polyangiaceae bacterium]|nr:ABC transporter ATP-binding protein [Polyangiaceae bacterium]